MLFATVTFAALPGTLGHPDVAPGANVDSTVSPSIEILPNQNMPNALIHHRPRTELQAKFSMEFCMAILLLERKAGLEQFTDETGTNIGPYNAIYPSFHILGFGGGLAPNTNITVSVTTYTGAALSGHASYVSTLVFNCTTGGIVSLSDGFSVGASIPTLSNVALIATTLLLAAVAVFSLRHKRGQARL